MNNYLWSGAIVLVKALTLLISTCTTALADDEIPKNFTYLRDVAPTIHQDIRYASAQNFTGQPLPGYDAAECILAIPVAKALKRVQDRLKPQGFSLKVYDCYRPRRAVRAFVKWARSNLESEYTKLYYPSLRKKELFARGYIARPSAHSKGIAVDLTIVPHPSPFTTSLSNAKHGPCNAPQSERQPDNSVDMGTAWDCFDERSHTFNDNISDRQKQLRNLLLTAMKKEGFENYSKEWWHFTLNADGYTKYHDFIIVKHKAPFFSFWK
ncbi:MAG: M15 family metallopeptidase [Methyloligellaceae bacterium]